MTVAALLDSLKPRRIELFAVSGSIRVRPRGALTADERAAVVAHKDELLVALTQATRTTETPKEWAAVLLYSRRLRREVWLVRDTAGLDETIADEISGRPVVFGADLPQLRGLADNALAAALDALATFSRAGLVTDSGEPLTPARTLFPASGTGTPA